MFRFPSAPKAAAAALAASAVALPLSAGSPPRPARAEPPPAAAAAPTLTTRFTYTAAVPKGAGGAKEVRLWVPVPSDGPWQTVRGLSVRSTGEYRITIEPKYGDRMVYLVFRRPAGPVSAAVTFTVERAAVRGLGAGAGAAAPAVAAAAREAAYLGSDRLVPVSGKYADIARGVTRAANVVPADRLGTMRSLFDHVVATLRYDYKHESPENGRGDVAFVCDYKKGNRSDLHSYLISLARSSGVPSYLEFGLPVSGVPVASPLPQDGRVSGYHCWVWFRDPARGWVPLDAADGRRWLDAGRPEVTDSLFGGLVTERTAVAVSRGRDVTLSPPQKGEPLNYFIYPYAEADGRPVDATWSVTYHIVRDAASPGVTLKAP